MTIEEFNKSLEDKTPPSMIGPLLLALWYDAKGDWEKSHSIAQDIETKEGALIHAYLHRKEGDLWNAKYWYRNAGEELPEIHLEAELKQLIIKFLMQPE